MSTAIDRTSQMELYKYRCPFCEKKHVRNSKRVMRIRCRCQKIIYLSEENLIGNKMAEKKYKNKDWLIDKYYVKKMTLKEISNLCSVGYAVIAKWMNKFELERRKLTESHIYDFINKYRNEKWLIEKYVIEKLTVKEISKKYEISEGKIGFWLKKFQISKRSARDAQLLKNKNRLKKYDNKNWLLKELKEKTIEQIAIDCNTTIYTIKNWLKKYGILLQYKRKRYIKIDNSPIRSYTLLCQEYLINLLTITEISKKYNVSTNKVKKQLERFNIPLKISYMMLKKNLKSKNIDCDYIKHLLSVYSKRFWRPKIFARDNYTCRRCGKQTNINAHHIIPFSFIRNIIFLELQVFDNIIDDWRLNDLDNGITLCNECHKAYHKIFGTKITGCIDEIIVDEIKDDYSFFGRIKTGINILNREYFKIYGEKKEIERKLQKNIIKGFTFDKKNGSRLVVLNG